MTADESEQLRRLARTINAKMLSRKDVKAEQFANGGYSPVETRKGSGEYAPWSEQDMLDHLMGHKTYGHYLVGQDDTAKLFAFDIDLVKPSPSNIEPGDPRYVRPTWFGEQFSPREVWAGEWTEGDANFDIQRDMACQLWAMAEGLARRTMQLMGDAVTVAVSYSGCKGVHVYGLCGKTPAGELRACAREVIDSFGVFQQSKGANFFRHVELYDCLEIETFPKQDGVGNGGFGNLLRCPLGVNRKTGQAGFFIKANPATTPSHTMKMEHDDPILALNAGTFR
ncbi:MAG: hypothetical protein AB7O86_05815 [Porticoccaceae bacterium]